MSDADYHRRYNRARYARFAAAGLCTKCGGPRRDGDRRRCARCAGRHAGYNAAYALKKREAALPRCTRCGTPFDEQGYRTCGLCRAEARARREG